MNTKTSPQQYLNLQLCQKNCKMPRIKIQKQLLWDVRSEELPDRHNFVLVVIDNRIESNKTEQKVKEKIQRWRKEL